MGSYRKGRCWWWWNTYYQMDIICEYLRDQLPNLSKVALSVLTIARSHAAEEQVFSLVWKNKMNFSANLEMETSMSSIMTIKINKATTMSSILSPGKNSQRCASQVSIQRSITGPTQAKKILVTDRIMHIRLNHHNSLFKYNLHSHVLCWHWLILWWHLVSR